MSRYVSICALLALLVAACTPLDPSGSVDGSAPAYGDATIPITSPDGAVDLTDGARPEAGSVLSDGSVGADTGPSGPAAPEPCSEESAERCSGAAGGRQRCIAGLWTPAPNCAVNEICSNDPKPGSCKAVSEVCRGNANQAVCDGQGTLYRCSAQAVAESQEVCGSSQLCQMGLAARKCLTCLPGSYQCTGAALERCNAQGTAFELLKTCASEALCKPSVGDCSSMACLPQSHTCESNLLRRCNAGQTGYEDVKPCSSALLCDGPNAQCDNCTAGTVGCESNTVTSCSADGQTLTRTMCPAATPFCVGLGRCVRCGGDADCADPGACKTRHCNLASGECEPQNQAARTPCSAGLCDGAGQCAGCLRDSDCPDPGDCKTASCNLTTHACEPKNVAAGNRCGSVGYCNNAGACVGCTAASQCPAQACRSASCSGGQCTYTPLAAGSKDTARCSLDQVCSGTGACVDCVAKEHCSQPSTSSCQEAVCKSNQCVSQARTGACDTLKICINGACVRSCGNGMVDPGTNENCEIGVGGQDSWSCDSQTCRTTGYSGSTLSNMCTKDSDCSPNEVCDDTQYFGFAMCLPRCTAAGAAGTCTLPTGWTALPCGNRGCLVHCTASGSCPSTTACTTTTSAGMCL